MYKRILIPIDFGHGHGRAIAVARKLLDVSGKLTLLHVIEEIPAYAATYLPGGTLEANRTDALSNLQSIGETVGDKCSSAVVSGHPSRAILDYANKYDPDCIIISSHKPGLEDYFLGSTASRVVRHATCCVHVLR